MRARLGFLVLVLSLTACGSTSDTGNQAGGGAATGGDGSAGRSNNAGASAGGAAGSNSAGSDSAGSNDAGSNSNKAGSGGRIEGSSGSGVGGIGGTSTVGGGGGTASVDPRCPAQRPSGACDADDTGLSCQYDNISSCLCYPATPGVYTPCQKVDPTCPSPPASTPAAGSGGASGKVAPPPVQVCSCTGATWTCHF